MSARSPRARWAVAACALLTAIACTDPKPKAHGRRGAPADLVIGVVAPLTGPNAAYGTSLRSGIALALDEVNAAGGVDGARIAGLFLDDHSRTSEAEVAARKLLDEERLVVLIGEVSSSATKVVASVAERAQVPLVVPSATEAGLTALGDHVFRACFVDPLQAEVMAHFAREQLKLARVAIARDLGSEYSIGLAKAFREHFTSLGGVVTADLHYGRDDVSFAELVAKLTADRPDALYLPGYAPEIAALSKAVRAAGLELVLLGADGFDASELYRDGAAALEGSYFTTHYAPDEPVPAVERFVRAFGATYNEVPDAFAALGYDAARLALRAIDDSRPLDRASMTAALARIDDFDGVTGRISLTSKVSTKPAVVVQVERGRRVFTARRAPPR
ncbi:ABC transporter substrate-binding protein [Myxococcota bacterium]|nr:ABC transporter substrate-binding protein [Myxococcota bacterium]